MSIVSYNIYSEPFLVFDVNKPSFYKWNEIEPTLKSVLKPEELEYVEAKVSSTKASRSRGVSKDFISKLWLVHEHLA